MITGPRYWTNHEGGYYVCSHMGCRKKVDSLHITDHDCCGRCQRGRDCLNTAMNNYDGPGPFAHVCYEVLLRPGVCEICKEKVSE